jgi:hypothetical protein
VFEYRYPDADPQLDYYYATVVANVFQDAFAPDVVLRAVRENPLVTESAVGIRNDKGGPRVFTLESSVLLFRYAEIASARRGHVDGNGRHVSDDGLVAGYQAEVPASPRDVKVARCEVPVDAALAARIGLLWDAMLRATRYESRAEADADAKTNETTTMVDGSTYHYSMRGMNAQAMAPDPGSRTDLLAGIADGMAAYCADRNATALAALTRDVGALEQRLQSDGAK